MHDPARGAANIDFQLFPDTIYASLVGGTTGAAAAVAAVVFEPHVIARVARDADDGQLKQLQAAVTLWVSGTVGVVVLLRWLQALTGHGGGPGYFATAPPDLFGFAAAVAGVLALLFTAYVLMLDALLDIDFTAMVTWIGRLSILSGIAAYPLYLAVT